MRMNARDVANATLSTRFGAVEELMREVGNDLREMRIRQSSPDEPRQRRGTISIPKHPVAAPDFP